MKEHLTVITRKGQITIPAEVRRALDLKEGDRVTLTMESGEVRLAPARYTLESAYGAVEPKSRPENLEEISRRSKEHKAKDIVEELSDR